MKLEISGNQKEKFCEIVLKKLETSEKQKICLDSKEWLENIPAKNGIYGVWSGKELKYVGETSDIRDRMKDLGRNVHNHTLAVKLANKYFKGKKWSQKKTLPKRLVSKLHEKIKGDFKISFLPLSMGRKEIEEYIVKKRNPVYNKKIKRGNKNKST